MLYGRRQSQTSDTRILSRKPLRQLVHEGLLTGGCFKGGGGGLRVAIIHAEGLTLSLVNDTIWIGEWPLVLRELISLQLGLVPLWPCPSLYTPASLKSGLHSWDVLVRDFQDMKGVKSQHLFYGLWVSSHCTFTLLHCIINACFVGDSTSLPDSIPFSLPIFTAGKRKEKESQPYL